MSTKTESSSCRIGPAEYKYHVIDVLEQGRASLQLLRLTLLALAVAGVFFRPFKIPQWLVPMACSGVLIATGALSPTGAVDAIRPLLQPLAFLLLAVPLAVMLDRLNFFESLAALVDGGRHAVLGLWVMAALVTTFLNLDASVVLLTPLFVRIARRHGFDPRFLAFQPALLACLASSALTISNLTNLIAAEQLHVSTADFALHLGPASLAAIVVGWFAYRRSGELHPTREVVRESVDARGLWLGTPIALLVVIGFTMGEYVGIPAWCVALVADLILIGLTRSISARDFPLDAALLAVALGIVSVGAVDVLHVDRLLNGSGVFAQLRALGTGVVGANAINNLPALMVVLPALKVNHDLLWPLLFGVNVGPVLVLHGALAGLLWRDTAAGLGVHVTSGEYTKMGLRVGLPALLGGSAVLLLTSTMIGLMGV